MLQLITAVVSATLLTFACAAPLSAQKLLRDAPPLASPVPLASPEPVSRTILRQRMMEVDVQTLSDMLSLSALPGGQLARQQSSGLGASSVDLNLFDDTTLKATLKRIERGTDERTIWTGKIDGPSEGTATLVVKGRDVLGFITAGTRVFEIRPVPGAAHVRVIEIDQNQFPRETEPLSEPKVNSIEPKSTFASPQPAHDVDPTTITILVAYTPAARAASSDIVSEINAAIASTNDVYIESGVNIRLSLLGTMEVTGYDETSGSFEDQLSRLRSTSDGFMDSVHSQRTSLGADLVALIVERGEYCGIAYLYTGSSTNGFSVTNRGCATSNLSFAHELGHNMGAEHDRYVVSGASATAYNYGYVLLSAQVRTVMAYNNQCRDIGVSCTRVRRFSSPNLTWSGSALGVAAGGTSPADNVRRLNDTRAAVAAFGTGSTATGPANDNFASAIAISGTSGSTTGTNASATRQTGEPSHASLSGATTSVWWKWIPTSSGTATFTTAGSSFDTVLGIYTGSGLSALTTVASNDDCATASDLTSCASFSATAEVTYYIAVAGYNAATGSVQLNWSCANCTAPTTIAPQSGWWWDPTWSGHGVGIEVSGNNIFLAFYTYESDRTAVWAVSSGVMTDRATYSGVIYQYQNGQTLTGSYRAPSLVGAIDTISLTFTSSTAGTMRLGSGTTFNIERFNIVLGGVALGTRSLAPVAGWWWDPSAPGTGYFLEAQGSSDTLFVAAYLYDPTDGTATWYASSGSLLALSSGYQFSGTLYEYSGIPVSAGRQGVTAATSKGTLAIQFTGRTRGTVTLPSGRQVPIERYQFGQVTSGFYEDFKGTSATNWQQDSGTWALTGGDWWYTLGTVGASVVSTYNETFSDFTYRAMLWRYGDASSSNRLYVRASGTIDSTGHPPNGYLFQYTRDGYFSVYKRINSVFVAIRDWQSTSVINSGSAYNELKVVASGSSLSYYINGTLVWSGTDTSFTSGKVGVGMFRTSTSAGSSLFVDYAELLVTNLDRSAATTAAPIPMTPKLVANRHALSLTTEASQADQSPGKGAIEADTNKACCRGTDARAPRLP